MADYAVETLAEDALLLRFGEGIDKATNARVHAAAEALRNAAAPGVTDIAPAYATGNRPGSPAVTTRAGSRVS